MWYYLKEGKKCGPVSLDQLRQRVLANKLRPEDLVWKDGTPQWVAARTVSELWGTPDLMPTYPPSLVGPLPSPAQPRPPFGRRALAWGRWACREAARVGPETYHHAAGVVRRARLRAQENALTSRALATQRELGERLYLTGVGDEQLRAEIAHLDQQLREALLAQGPVAELNRSREALLRRLADEALDGRVPVAETVRADRDRAAQARRDLQQFQARMAAPEAGQLTADQPNPWRVAVGYGAIGLLLVVLGLVLFRAV